MGGGAFLQYKFHQYCSGGAGGGAKVMARKGALKPCSMVLYNQVQKGFHEIVKRD